MIVPEEGSGPFGPLPAAHALEATFFPTVPAFLRRSWPPTGPLPAGESAPDDHRRRAAPPETARRFREIHGRAVHVFYGSSETGGISFDREGSAGERGSVGKPVDGVTVAPAPPRRSASGRAEPEPDLDRGGWRSRRRRWPPATCRRTLRRPTGCRTAASGPATWPAGFTVGGELVLAGRTDDLINVRGKKVDPREVEGVLSGLPGVHEVLALGAADAGRAEQILRVVVACDPGRLDPGPGVRLVPGAPGRAQGPPERGVRGRAAPDLSGQDRPGGGPGPASPAASRRRALPLPGPLTDSTGPTGSDGSTGRPPRPCRRPPLVTGSLALHALALPVLAAAPGLRAATAALLVADHALLMGTGMLPRSRPLGPEPAPLSESSPRRRSPGRAGGGSRVALTFDDGPDPEITPRVLDLLDEHGARASFFCIGERVERHPDLAAEIARRGHRVENHTHRHLNRFAMLPPGGLGREIDRAQEAIAGATGRAPALFRPPAGIRSPLLEPALARRGLWLASWTRRGYDTVRSDPERVLAALERNLAPGDVLLLHDGRMVGGTGGNRVVLEVLPRLLARLAEAGLRSVPLPAPEAPRQQNSPRMDESNRRNALVTGGSGGSARPASAPSPPGASPSR